MNGSALPGSAITSGALRFEKSKFVFVPEGLSSGLGPDHEIPSLEVAPRIFVWNVVPLTILRPASSMR